MFEKISIKSSERNDLIDITNIIQDMIRKNNFTNGLITLFVPHTTAAVTINENADPTVKTDMLKFLKDKIPVNYDFDHMEGNSDAHLKSSIIGPSLSLIVEEGELILGTWQGIYFCEFDGPRTRSLYVKSIRG